MPMDSIVLAYDCAPPAAAALETATEIVARTGAKLTIVCVHPARPGFEGQFPPGGAADEAMEATRSRLARVKEELHRKGIAQVDIVFLEGDPVDRVLEVAHERSAGLIVVGSRGLTGAGRFFLGSVSDGILHHSRCSVLIVKSELARPPGRGDAPPRSRR